MNGQLFTQDFLARGIAASPVWTAFPEAQLDAFVEALRRCMDRIRRLGGRVLEWLPGRHN